MSFVPKKRIFRVLPGLVIYSLLATLLFSFIFRPALFWMICSAFFVYNLYLMAFIAYYSNKGVNQFIESAKHEFPAPTDDSPIHFVLIPNYKEPESVLTETILNISKSNIAKTNIIPVLAMEAREQEASKKANMLVNSYSHLFKDMLVSMHPPNLPNEVPGKSSNEACGFRVVEQYVEDKKMNTNNCIVTTCDADSMIHVKYFEFVSQKFKASADPFNRIWQSTIVNYKNYAELPRMCMLMSTAVSLHETACLADASDVHIPFSTYSMSYNLAHMAGGWDGDVIAEDWHMLIKCLFESKGQVSVEPIPLPMLCSTVDGYWDRFTQSKRHAWGIAEISYFMDRLWHMFISGESSMFSLKILRYFVKMINIHTFASMNIVVMILAQLNILAYANVHFFASSSSAHDVVNFWSSIFAYQGLALLPITACILYANYVLCKHLEAFPVSIVSVVNWVINFLTLTLPANLVFASIPELWAYYKLMFQDNIEYVVAPKAPTPATPTTSPANYAPLSTSSVEDELRLAAEQGTQQV